MNYGRPDFIINKRYITFPVFEGFSPLVIHGFSTRLGGVGQYPYNTLNLGFKSRDNPMDVKTNYGLILGDLGIEAGNLVFSNQVHGDNCEVIFEKPPGGRVQIPCDALITDRPEIALVGHFADCVPVFLFDPKKGVCSIIHSGWKGTAKDIVARVVDKIKYLFNCNPGDIHVALGPAIGKCCFETHDDVVMEFRRRLKWSEKYMTGLTSGKYRIDLKSVIVHSLIMNGVKETNIYKSPLCTKCHKDIFFSHRGDGGRTGTMAGIIQMTGEFSK